jgi:hypothetical protein
MRSGEDFASSTLSAHLASVTGKHLKQCDGRGVIVVDEFHKIPPSALVGKSLEGCVRCLCLMQ